MVIQEKLTPILGLKSSVELDIVKRIDLVKQIDAKWDKNSKEIFFEQNKDIFIGLRCFPDICKIK